MDNQDTAGNPAPADTQFSPDDVEKNKVMGILAYVIFFIPLLAAGTSPFARYHANQGLVLLIACIVGSVVFGVLTFVLGFIPILGGIISMLLYVGFVLGVLGLWILGIVNAAQGKAAPLPVIGKFTLIR